MKLYKLADSYATIQALLEESEGEITPEIEAMLNEADKTLEQKIDNISSFVRSLQAEEEACAKEAEHFRRRAQTARKKSQSVKSYLLRCMDQIGITNAHGRLFKVTVCKNSSPSIRWTRPEENPPQEFLRHTVEVDLVKAKAFLSEQGSLPDGFVVDHGRHVKIT